MIVDGIDFIFSNLKSFKIILRYPKIKNSKLVRTVYTISKNHPLDKKIQMLLGKARSPRRIVNNLEVVKKWLGINSIIISK